jgi:hypothetical protein
MSRQGFGKMLVNGDESPASSARFVRRLFVMHDTKSDKKHHSNLERIIA